ncbi:hypothetical protein ACYCVF_32130 [Bradyrhizobium sp. 1.29L]
MTEIVDMPDGTVDLLFGFLRQNEGVLSKRGREKEFAKLTDDEVATSAHFKPLRGSSGQADFPQSILGARNRRDGLSAGTSKKCRRATFRRFTSAPAALSLRTGRRQCLQQMWGGVRLDTGLGAEDRRTVG